MASPLFAVIAAAALANGSATVATRSADALPVAGTAAKVAHLAPAKVAPQAGACVVANGKASAVRGRAVKAKCQTNPQVAGGSGAGGVLGMGISSTMAAAAMAAAAAAGLSYLIIDSTGSTISRG